MPDTRSVEEEANREGVASGSATRVLGIFWYKSQKKLKICKSFTEAPSHAKQVAILDVRGLWHRGLWYARLLPPTSPFDKSKPAAAHPINSKKTLPCIKSILITTCFIFFLWLHCLAVKNQF